MNESIGIKDRALKRKGKEGKMKKAKMKINCWICEKSIMKKENNHVVSKELHDFIMAQNKLKAGYFLGFNALADFLIGDEENSRLYNMCGKPDYNGDPRAWALEILRKCGADSKLK